MRRTAGHTGLRHPVRNTWDHSSTGEVVFGPHLARWARIGHDISASGRGIPVTDRAVSVTAYMEPFHVRLNGAT